MKEITSFQRQILSEMKSRTKNGIYRYTQIEMAYHSNAIEGSTVTLEDTIALFDTIEYESHEEIIKENIIAENDAQETYNHFAAFRYILKTYSENLSEEHIKTIHKILKQGTLDEKKSYKVGEYKDRGNTIGGFITASPNDVPNLMKEFVDSYNNTEFNIHNLAKMHSDFETIHPFQDGNGRVGRLLLYRECLHHNVLPFIIHQGNRFAYATCLKNIQSKYTDTGLDALVDLFKREQQTYKNKLCQLYPFMFMKKCERKDNAQCLIGKK